MIYHILETMRPTHWIKNFFVFVPLFFSGSATVLLNLTMVFLVFISFCAIASAVYFLNDIIDSERDRHHPLKSLRPIASGALPVRIALAVGSGLALFSFVLAYSINLYVLLLLLIYSTLNVMYCYWLKHIVIVDVFVISLMFVLRVLTGGAVIHVELSSWLLITTFLLALFLALAKRRHELVFIEDSIHSQRPVLYQYSSQLADELMSLISPVILVTYILYTLSAETLARFHSNVLYSTSIFVVFGIMRYLYLVHQKNLGDDPSDMVIHDIPLLAAILGWVLSYCYMIYF
jgi:4-hydroxybenzoate polyprenyltransferase